MRVFAVLIAIIIAFIILYTINQDILLFQLKSDKYTLRYNCYFREGFYENKLKTSKDKPFRIIGTHNKNNNTKIFTASIYGTHPKYFNGMLNLIDRFKNGPIHGWTLRVYCHDRVPPDYINKILNCQWVETQIVEDEVVTPGNSAGMFWRFMPLSENITFMSLDVDEELTDNFSVIDAWDKHPARFIRFTPDLYPWTKTHIVGKYFGSKAGYTLLKPEFITNYAFREPFGADEVFLTYIMWPLIKTDKIISRMPNKFISKLCFKIAKNNSVFNSYDPLVDTIMLEN